MFIVQKAQAKFGIRSLEYSAMFRKFRIHEKNKMSLGNLSQSIFSFHSVRACRLSVRARREPTVILDKLPMTYFGKRRKWDEINGFVIG